MIFSGTEGYLIQKRRCHRSIVDAVDVPVSRRQKDPDGRQRRKEERTRETSSIDIIHNNCGRSRVSGSTRRVYRLWRHCFL